MGGKIREKPRNDSQARREISFSFFHETYIRLCPPACVYFVSFYITGYPRDLDSICFLLALGP